jgi:hypothetical protein
MFLIVDFLAHKILGIVESQIKHKEVFYWLEYLLTLGDAIYRLKI